MIDDPAGRIPAIRDYSELIQTAQGRFEATEAAAARWGFDLDRARAAGVAMLEGIHAGPAQEQVMWVLEIAAAMLTAVMAVNGEPLPVTDEVDPASYGMSVLRDLQTAAGEEGLDWPGLEAAAAVALRGADAAGHSNIEAFWGLNHATASVELGWARNLAEAGGGEQSEEP